MTWTCNPGTSLLSSAKRCLEQGHREAVSSDRFVSTVRAAESPVIPFRIAYDRVHECLTSVLCRFLIYEVLVHTADTQRSKLWHLLYMHPECHAWPWIQQSSTISARSNKRTDEIHPHGSSPLSMEMGNMPTTLCRSSIQGAVDLATLQYSAMFAGGCSSH